MAFDFNTLEPQIHQILSAPGTDLTTISAKSVRRRLLELEPSLSSSLLKEHREDVDDVIARVFEQVSAERGFSATQDMDQPAEQKRAGSRKRKEVNDEAEDEEGEREDAEETPPPKKAKKAGKKELSDAEIARRLSSEINGRSTRGAGGRGRGNTNGTPKKGGRPKKSAAMVDSDGDSYDDSDNKKPKKRSGSGAAKGGFAKEYALSEPLAALLKVEKLSRPQVVKQLWDHIKGNDLQNPGNKREIICDAGFKAVFGVDKIDMFRMNKVLGQHLHEN